MPSTVEQAARAVFGAYSTGDREAIEEILAADFQFTSPYDDAIDRETYFQRCWPGHELMRGIEVEKVMVDGDEAFVTYVVHMKDGRLFRNTEFMRFVGGELVSVNVYFGASYASDGEFVRQSSPKK
jgi:ketosteroid isomerase-like protein